MGVTPWLQDADCKLYHGDCLEVLRELPTGSVHMCATSPPFYGLRDYGTEGQIGLEETPDEWVNRLVDVFREVRRVLRDDGTLWVEIGDSYNGSSVVDRSPESLAKSTLGPKREGLGADNAAHQAQVGRNKQTAAPGLKPKDLLGQPWLLAFALRADGWYLRSEIIWARPNPMPESVTDRPTKAHSTVFLLSKQPRYFYDADAIREPASPNTHARYAVARDTPKGEAKTASGHGHAGWDKSTNGYVSSANARSVWTIPTEPTPFAHFATWPQALVRRMILAGTSEKGCCPECGAPWVRETERVQTKDGEAYESRMGRWGKDFTPAHQGGRSFQVPIRYNISQSESLTVGWSPSCKCEEESWNDTTSSSSTRTESVTGFSQSKKLEPTTRTKIGSESKLRNTKFTTDVNSIGSTPNPVPCTVLDPFAGSGTTLLVARKHGRHSIGIELNAQYLEIAAKRLQQLSLLA